MRIGGDDSPLDAVLKPRHDGEHDDEGAHPEKHAAHADPYEQREVGPLATRTQIAQGEEQLEGQAAPAHDASGSSSSPAAWAEAGRSRRRWGKRITSRMEAELVKSMASRSIPMPSPAVGGTPYSRART